MGENAGKFLTVQKNHLIKQQRSLYKSQTWKSYLKRRSISSFNTLTGRFLQMRNVLKHYSLGACIL